LRTSAGVTVYVDPVAPSIGWPSASHWRWVRPAGVQVPGVAVRTWSTWGVPEMAGASLARNCPGAIRAVRSERTVVVV